MKITRKVWKTGNSLVVSFPPLLLEMLDVSVNDAVEIEYGGTNVITLRAAKDDATADYIGTNN